MPEHNLPQNIKHVQVTMEEILGSKIRVKDVSINKTIKSKQYFVDILNALSLSNINNFIAVNEIGIDLSKFVEPYIQAVDCLFSIAYNQKQIDIIYWWLYEKYLPSGDVLELVDQTTGDKISTDTPEDIWEIVESLKSKK